jgi:hypothetical protein
VNKITVGTVVCVLTALVCVVLFKTSHMSAFITLQITAMVWLVAGTWVGNTFNAENRALRQRSMRDLYKIAKARALPKETPIASAMNVGGLVMFALAYIYFN